MNTIRTCFLLMLLTVMTAGLTAVPAIARPDMRPLGKNIADTGSAWYRFQSKSLSHRMGNGTIGCGLLSPKRCAARRLSGALATGWQCGDGTFDRTSA